jgi:hypothetical protein
MVATTSTDPILLKTELQAMSVQCTADGGRTRQAESSCQDGSRCRRAVHMQTALVRCANGARDQTVEPPHADGPPDRRRRRACANCRGSPCCHCAGTCTATCHKVQLWQSTIGLGRLRVAWRRWRQDGLAVSSESGCGPERLAVRE